MSDDALKALLSADAPTPPARDLAFTLEVMAKVTRRRMIEGVVTLVLCVVAVSALLYVVMPYVTPALVRLSAPLLPAAGILAAIVVCAICWDQVRPALRQYGLRV